MVGVTSCEKGSCIVTTESHPIPRILGWPVGRGGRRNCAILQGDATNFVAQGGVTF